MTAPLPAYTGCPACKRPWSLCPLAAYERRVGGWQVHVGPCEECGRVASGRGETPQDAYADARQRLRDEGEA